MTEILPKITSQDYTILVVDDNPTNLQVVVNYLTEFGFKMLMAKNGLMCLKIAAARQPQLILLDVMMPELNGFETCQRLKADATTRNIPVIFMTALTSEDDKVRGFEAGAVDYVTKPIQQREVLARVTTHLQIAELARQLAQKNEQLNHTNQTLMELNASKDRFFSIVAHDLKGPFMPLLGFSELLSQMTDTFSMAEIKMMATQINRSARNTFNLLESLLTWARLQMERMEYHPQRLDLAEMAAKTVELLADNAQVKQIDLHSEVQPNTWVYADENMLDTVIRNLTNNALKFTPPGGQVRIGSRELGIRREELGIRKEELGIGKEDLGIRNQVTPHSQLLIPHYVEVSIADTGVGMSEEVRQKLFKIDQHVTTMGTDKETGTGLGLIICQEMVVKSGGKIWVESEVGQGTTVRFTVQLEQEK